jgi:membrane associated rhomboid family serine protease
MYVRGGGPLYQVNRLFGSSRAPVTAVIVALNAILFIVDFFTRSALEPLLNTVAPVDAIREPWTLLTYTLLTPGYMSLLLIEIPSVLFAAIWFYWVGASLERSWGSARFAVFFTAVTLATSLGYLGGEILLRTSYPQGIDGLWVPTIACTVAWAALNPMERILFWGVFPMEARWLALLLVGIFLFVGFRPAPFLGVFALLGCLVALMWIRYGWAYSGLSDLFDRPKLRSSNRRFTIEDRPTGITGWWRERQERKRLERLLGDKRDDHWGDH